MHTVEVPAGDHIVTLTLPMALRVERRAPYAIAPPPAAPVAANAVNVVRGPLLYALPRARVEDRPTTAASPWDEVVRVSGWLSALGHEDV